MLTSLWSYSYNKSPLQLNSLGLWWGSSCVWINVSSTLGFTCFHWGSTLKWLGSWGPLTTAPTHQSPSRSHLPELELAFCLKGIPMLKTWWRLLAVNACFFCSYPSHKHDPPPLATSLTKGSKQGVSTRAAGPLTGGDVFNMLSPTHFPWFSHLSSSDTEFWLLKLILLCPWLLQFSICLITFHLVFHSAVATAQNPCF